MDPSDSKKAYWRANLRLLLALLSIWAFVSYGLGILFAEALNQVRIPGTGFRLGFWFAQQGSIYVFCLLVFVYARRMNAIERRFGLFEDEDDGP
jgi:putative solute:sodium symporter small subunit